MYLPIPIYYLYFKYLKIAVRRIWSLVIEKIISDFWNSNNYKNNNSLRIFHSRYLLYNNEFS